VARSPEVSAQDAPFRDLSLAQLRRRRTEKWRHFPPDVLPAFVAEMDFPLAPPIERAIVEAVKAGETGYASALPELSNALAGFASSRFGWPLDPEGVRVIPDVMVGVTEFLRVAARPGDAVVINPPVYPPFFSHVPEAGCRIVEAPLAYTEHGYALNLEPVERAFREGARFYLLCNPHNPTGRVFTRRQLMNIAELAEEYSVTVLADEIHAPLVYRGGEHVPFLSLGPPAVERAIAFVSASKGWNIPGLKCAQAVVASDEMRAVLDRLPEELMARVGNLGVLASVVAYRDAVGWLDELLQILDESRKLMVTLLKERLPGVRYFQPQGTYLAWLDCRALKLPQEPVDFFLERGKVALGPGPRFGSQGKGFVRITMGTSPAILTEIVERMAAAVERTRPE
jgi:cystathionine beta-lyase